MKENTKNILLGVLIVGLVAMTVAYAALTTNLQINGTATVAATKWDIHFANVAVDTGTGKTNIPSGDYSLGTLDSTNLPSASATGTLIDDLTVTLRKPGDKLVVNFDIVNAGTIDAKNTSFVKHITKGSTVSSSDTAATNDVVTYTIQCGTGANGGDSQLAKANGNTPTAAACVLTIEHNDTGASITQAHQEAGTDQTINNEAMTFKFDAAWVYQQY